MAKAKKAAKKVSKKELKERVEKLKEVGEAHDELKSDYEQKMQAIEGQILKLAEVGAEEHSRFRTNVASLVEEVNEIVGGDRPAVLLGSELTEREFTPTGLTELDDMTGGLPNGKFCIIWGQYGVGKSTLAYQIAGNCLCADPLSIVVLVDVENTADTAWFKTHAALPSNAVVVRVSKTDESLETMLTNLNKVMHIAEKHKIKVSMVIVDSIHGLGTRRELGGKKDKKGNIKDRDLEVDDIASLAKKMSDFVRATNGKFAVWGAPVVLIGQARTTGIGSSMVRDGLSGGHAVKHAARLIIKLSKITAADKQYRNTEGEVIGWPVRAKLEKVDNSNRDAVLDLHFLQGIGYDDLRSNVMYAATTGIITARGGGFYEWGEEKIRGAENLVEYFRSRYNTAYGTLLNQIREYRSRRHNEEAVKLAEEAEKHRGLTDQQSEHSEPEKTEEAEDA